ncbi:MAG: Rossmann-like and DUF2520 domain-containing protein [Gemmatimonadales bacterium]
MSAAPRVAIIGPGRLGNGLARALEGAGWGVVLLGRNVVDEWRGQLKERPLVVVAVPDDAIADVAAELVRAGAITSAHVVLHTSGACDRTALAPLAGTGAALGSFAPVQTVADPATAAERLRGAYAVIEGDAAAVASGHRLAEALGMHAAEITSAAKVAYHAGAVLVANLGTALFAMAERVAVEGGVPPALAAKLYLPLWQGALTNVEAMGAVGALTGPVRRGDVETVRRHLALLTGTERAAYVALSLEALRLARMAGLASGRARAVELALQE